MKLCHPKRYYLTALSLGVLLIFSDAQGSSLEGVLSADQDLSVQDMDSIDVDELSARTQSAIQIAAQTPQAITQAAVPSSREEFCKRQEHPEVVSALADLPSMNMGFQNQGGILGLTGVCWWHSRLQRSALYLANFRPELPKPTGSEVRQIFKNLQRNRSVVEIGGYANWAEFSYAWENELQKDLNRWQLGDTLIRQAWVNGLMNRAQPHGAKGAERLNKLVQLIVIQVKEKKQIAYVKLPMRHLMAHAWLITQVTPTENGYDFRVIDSNITPVFFDENGKYVGGTFGEDLGAFTYSYHQGDEFFYDADYGEFSPFLQHRGDFNRINQAIKNYCGN